MPPIAEAGRTGSGKPPKGQQRQQPQSRQQHSSQQPSPQPQSPQPQSPRPQSPLSQSPQLPSPPGEVEEADDRFSLQVQVSKGRRISRKTSRTMDQYSSDLSAAKEFFKKEPCLHTHRMFDRAAKIFSGLKRAKEDKAKRRENREAGGKDDRRGSGPASAIPPLDFNTPTEKRLTFELAFSSLKYQNVFDEMLDDCAFFIVYPGLRDDEALVMVVLWDYQSRKFQPRMILEDADELVPDISTIERAILEQKTKLAASLARRRIKASAPNIEYLLPDNVRTKSTSQQPMPVYAWVNTLKMTPVEMLQKLREEGFTQMWQAPKVAKEFQEKSFFVDPHCSDLLVFSIDCNSILQEHSLIEQGYLVRQDKSSSLAVHSVIPLLGDEQDVVVVNPGAGFIPAHLAVLLKGRGCGVVIISEHQDEEHHKMLRNLELLGVLKYTKVIRDKFTQLELDDHRLRNVRAALIAADCSKSAINNIVNFIVTEGENLKVLQDMSDTSDDLDDRLNRLQSNHINVLRQTLRLHKIQGVAYLTRSVHDMENDLVVQRAIEYVNMMQMAKRLPPWRVIPPVIPYSADEIDEQVGIEGKYVRFKPTDMMNGCFLVAIAREPEDPADLMARTRAKGQAKGQRGKGKVTHQGSDEGVSKSDSNESVKSGGGRKRSIGSKKGKAAAKPGGATAAKPSPPAPKCPVYERRHQRSTQLASTRDWRNGRDEGRCPVLDWVSCSTPALVISPAPSHRKGSRKRRKGSNSHLTRCQSEPRAPSPRASRPSTPRDSPLEARRGGKVCITISLQL